MNAALTKVAYFLAPVQPRSTTLMVTRSINRAVTSEESIYTQISKQDSMAESKPENPSFNFTITPSLEPWNITSKQWFNANPNFQGLATGVIIFNANDQVLLLQRASHDSMPNRWEPPGGAVDSSDASMFHGAARETWEEAGLIATKFRHIVTEGPGKDYGQVFMNSTRTKLCTRYAFIAEVEDLEVVRLDPNEHQDWVWATEDDVRNERIGERELPITFGGMRNILLEAFRLRREGSGGS